jgi:hypothetical protein
MKALGCLFFLLVCVALFCAFPPLGVGVLVLGVVAKVLMR